MLRYYLGGGEYVRRGPPHVAVRVLVAPVVVASTVVLLTTGVALLALGETEGTLVGLHKASFLVWFGAMSVHVLMRVFRLLPALRLHTAGVAMRLGLVGASLAAGFMLATLTLPAADRLQDAMSGSVGIDAR
jgi:cytochrome b subunit of formate dehydrogenase